MDNNTPEHYGWCDEPSDVKLKALRIDRVCTTVERVCSALAKAVAVVLVAAIAKQVFF